MVSTHPRGSMGHSSSKSRKRTSLRRQSEKTIITTPPPVQEKQRSRSVSAGTIQQTIIQQPSTPAVVEMPRLSIADRFMSGPIPSVPQPSPSISITTSLALSNSTCSEMVNSRLSVADRFMNNNNNSNNLHTYSTRPLEPMPGRLTIADAFMKMDGSRDRASSFNELESSRYSNKSMHPLEEQTLFDESSQYLNLDLTILPPASSSSSSVLKNKPWGSQDTLVHHYHQERKKPIYAQFIESEKNATISDNRSFSLDYNDSPDHAMSDDLSTKHGYDDYDDVDIGYDKHYGHERQWSYEEEEEEEEEEPIPSPAVSTTKLKKVTPPPPPPPPPAPAPQIIDIEQQPLDDYDNNARGFWVGCCFVSCGQRPSRQTIEQRQKQRREKEIDEDIRPKNRGFGRRGWVFCTFLSLLVFILITYFLWPRTPLMRIEGASLTLPAKITETRQGVMVGNVAFESEWMVNITVDNRQNHIPTRLVQVQVLAKDALTGLVIGKGLRNDDPNPEHIILAPNTISTIQIPIHVDYQARDSTDTTFVDLSKACSPQQLIPFNSPDLQTTTREALPLHFWITLHFFGLDWLGYKPTVIAAPATGGFACPQS